ncbi:hypothetical protein L6164_003469 [Bauhinia variegata]|uniref:Uncharacterized protein n=1 Tax=Bauhinia variegata TaxID=167791 RepID=A0ACB9Q6W3_BAUVA|nr:hypothetical protein L6164_003469 [Bauhinia variegata]
MLFIFKSKRGDYRIFLSTPACHLSMQTDSVKFRIQEAQLVCGRIGLFPSVIALLQCSLDIVLLLQDKLPNQTTGIFAQRQKLFNFKNVGPLSHFFLCVPVWKALQIQYFIKSSIKFFFGGQRGEGAHKQGTIIVELHYL